MPIQCARIIASVTDSDFERIDRAVMACSYAIHNTVGNLCDESVYENDLAMRLTSDGCGQVETQVGVSVVHKGFEKVYRLDLVVDGMVYELKATAALATAHVAQAIHYAALLGIDRVKLVNFGGHSVQGRLVRAPDLRVRRTKSVLGIDRWRPLSAACVGLRHAVSDVVDDLGMFLELGLYEEILVHLLGGVAACNCRLPIVRSGMTLGTHRFLCHSPQVAMVVTALNQNADRHESQLRRLLGLSTLVGIQWINIHHSRMEMVTLTKSCAEAGGNG